MNSAACSSWTPRSSRASRPVPECSGRRLPAPASRITALVYAPFGEPVVLRAWKGSELLGSDERTQGTGELRVEAEGIDALTLDWGLNNRAFLAASAGSRRPATDTVAAWSDGRERLESAAERWTSSEPVLEPDSHYLLEVTTRAVLKKGAEEVQRVEQVRSIQFQTGGPPAIVPDWVDPPTDATAGAFPHGGVLKDLAPYVRWTIPAAGAVPVFRAYDLGCEFDATHVQQMYGADMCVRLRDDNASRCSTRPARRSCSRIPGRRRPPRR